MARECLNSETEALLIPSQRTRRGECEALVGFLAAADANGAHVDWPAFFAGRGAQRIELPTYAFQHKRYWPERRAGTVGLVTADHPLLGAALRVAGEDEWLFTGQLSLPTHPWLADHAVFGTVLVPGTVFVELALAVGGEVECEAIEELALEGPLVLPEQDAVELQLRLRAPGDAGRRELVVYARLRDSSERRLDDAPQWTRHASGVLAPLTSSDHGVGDEPSAEVWPPPGAEPVDVEFLYERLAEAGFGYGPAFQGVGATWRRGEEFFAEVSLSEAHAQQAGDFAIHPALLDAAFHALIGERHLSEPGKLPLPFSWTGLRLLRGGASALRVHLAPAADGALRITASDRTGAPVLSVDALKARPVDAGQLAAARRVGESSLFELKWTAIPLASSNGVPHRFATLGDLKIAGVDDRYGDVGALGEALGAGVAPPDVVFAAAPTGPPVANAAAAARACVQLTLELVRAWVTDDRLIHSRLMLITCAAVAAADGEAPDLATAPVWGLLRSAQSEHPGRFLLIDIDPVTTEVPWPALIATEEPQLAVRDGCAFAPRLTRAPSRPSDVASLDPEGTVLITGASGGLGTLIARHLAANWGARHLLLISRRGLRADGAEELIAELAQLGCAASVASCDVTDRDELAALIASIPVEFPLTAVIHAAGLLDDGTIGSLTAEQVERVMRPKVDGALHLHELTEHLELSDFVLFSSGAATLGAPGQGNYAAANAFLDALAQRRRAHGLLGTSLAWGLWNEENGMAGALEETAMAQIRRLGIAALTSEQGLALFDAALSVDRALLLPMRFDIAALRAQAQTWELPPPLRGLVRTTGWRAQDGGASLARQLAGVPEVERDALALEIVSGQAVAVLGYEAGEKVDPQRSFGDLGFDSLGAVELRNRLGHLLGQRLSATLVFDYPTIAAVASFLRSQVGEVATPRPAIDKELDNLESMLALLDTREDKQRVDARLRLLLASTAGKIGATINTKSIESGTADEIFELLDKELT